MEQQPLVSVIIPAYKAERYIERTIRSVLGQTHRNLEVIVVNDGSPDDLERVVLHLQNQDERLFYVRQDNAGVSQARNHGFRVSKGDFVAFLDADDVWLPDNLEKKLERFDRDEELGLVHSDAELIDSEDSPLGQTKEGKEGWILQDLLSWNGTCIPAPSSILVKRQVMQEVGGFEPRLSNSSDQEFFFRVAHRYKIGRVARVGWQYRIHNQNMHNNIALMERDALLAYRLAAQNGLFRSAGFRRRCFSNMYLIVGASWWGDGKNKWRGLGFLLRALWTYPPHIGRVLRKFLGR